MRLAPGVGDDVAAGLVGRETVVESVAVGSGDDEHVVGLCLRWHVARGEDQEACRKRRSDLSDLAIVGGDGGHSGLGTID